MSSATTYFASAETYQPSKLYIPSPLSKRCDVARQFRPADKGVVVELMASSPTSESSVTLLSAISNALRSEQVVPPASTTLKARRARRAPPTISIPTPEKRAVNLTRSYSVESQDGHHELPSFNEAISFGDEVYQEISYEWVKHADN